MLQGAEGSKLSWRSHLQAPETILWPSDLFECLKDVAEAILWDTYACVGHRHLHNITLRRWKNPAS
jgi:hypothetical protein